MRGAPAGPRSGAARVRTRVRKRSSSRAERRRAEQDSQVSTCTAISAGTLSPLARRSMSAGLGQGWAGTSGIPFQRGGQVGNELAESPGDAALGDVDLVGAHAALGAGLGGGDRAEGDEFEGLKRA